MNKHDREYHNQQQISPSTITSASTTLPSTTETFISSITFNPEEEYPDAIDPLSNASTPMKSTETADSFTKRNNVVESAAITNQVFGATTVGETLETIDSETSTTSDPTNSIDILNFGQSEVTGNLMPNTTIVNEFTLATDSYSKDENVSEPTEAVEDIIATTTVGDAESTVDSIIDATADESIDTTNTVFNFPDHWQYEGTSESLLYGANLESTVTIDSFRKTNSVGESKATTDLVVETTTIGEDTNSSDLFLDTTADLPIVTSNPRKNVRVYSETFDLLLSTSVGKLTKTTDALIGVKNTEASNEKTEEYSKSTTAGIMIQSSFDRNTDKSIKSETKSLIGIPYTAESTATSTSLPDSTTIVDTETANSLFSSNADIKLTKTPDQIFETTSTVITIDPLLETTVKAPNNPTDTSIDSIVFTGEFRTAPGSLLSSNSISKSTKFRREPTEISEWHLETSTNSEGIEILNSFTETTTSEPSNLSDPTFLVTNVEESSETSRLLFDSTFGVTTKLTHAFFNNVTSNEFTETSNQLLETTVDETIETVNPFIETRTDDTVSTFDLVFNITNTGDTIETSTLTINPTTTGISTEESNTNSGDSTETSTLSISPTTTGISTEENDLNFEIITIDGTTTTVNPFFDTTTINELFNLTDPTVLATNVEKSSETSRLLFDSTFSETTKPTYAFFDSVTGNEFTKTSNQLSETTIDETIETVNPFLENMTDDTINNFDLVLNISSTGDSTETSTLSINLTTTGISTDESHTNSGESTETSILSINSTTTVISIEERHTDTGDSTETSILSNNPTTTGISTEESHTNRGDSTETSILSINPTTTGISTEESYTNTGDSTEPSILSINPTTTGISTKESNTSSGDSTETSILSIYPTTTGISTEESYTNTGDSTETSILSINLTTTGISTEESNTSSGDSTETSILSINPKTTGISIEENHLDLETTIVDGTSATINPFLDSTIADNPSKSTDSYLDLNVKESTETSIQSFNPTIANDSTEKIDRGLGITTIDPFLMGDLGKLSARKDPTLYEKYFTESTLTSDPISLSKTEDEFKERASEMTSFVEHKELANHFIETEAAENLFNIKKFFAEFSKMDDGDQEKNNIWGTLDSTDSNQNRTTEDPASTADLALDVTQTRQPTTGSLFGSTISEKFTETSESPYDFKTASESREIGSDVSETTIDAITSTVDSILEMTNDEPSNSTKQPFMKTNAEESTGAVGPLLSSTTVDETPRTTYSFFNKEAVHETTKMTAPLFSSTTSGESVQATYPFFYNVTTGNEINKSLETRDKETITEIDPFRIANTDNFTIKTDPALELTTVGKSTDIIGPSLNATTNGKFTGVTEPFFAAKINNESTVTTEKTDSFIFEDLRTNDPFLNTKYEAKYTTARNPEFSLPKSKKSSDRNKQLSILLARLSELVGLVSEANDKKHEPHSLKIPDTVHEALSGSKTTKAWNPFLDVFADKPINMRNATADEVNDRELIDANFLMVNTKNSSSESTSEPPLSVTPYPVQSSSRASFSKETSTKLSLSMNSSTLRPRRTRFYNTPSRQVAHSPNIASLILIMPEKTSNAHTARMNPLAILNATNSISITSSPITSSSVTPASQSISQQSFLKQRLPNQEALQHNSSLQRPVGDSGLSLLPRTQHSPEQYSAIERFRLASPSTQSRSREQSLQQYPPRHQLPKLWSPKQSPTQVISSSQLPSQQGRPLQYMISQIPRQSHTSTELSPQQSLPVHQSSQLISTNQRLSQQRTHREHSTLQRTHQIRPSLGRFQQKRPIQQSHPQQHSSHQNRFQIITS